MCVMKLSEAIRLGGTLHPQKFGVLAARNAESHIVALYSSCLYVCYTVRYRTVITIT
jgi:hypothetical protein